jgi:hypothetical protein
MATRAALVCKVTHAFEGDNCQGAKGLASGKQWHRLFECRLLELTLNAVDRGTFGSRTCFVGDEMFFGRDQLRAVEKAIVTAISAKQRTSVILGAEAHHIGRVRTRHDWSVR